MRPTVRDAVWFALFTLACAVVAWLSDEVTEHAPAGPLEVTEPTVSAEAERAWVLLAARADHDPVWAKAVRGALFSGRNFGGEA